MPSIHPTELPGLLEDKVTIWLTSPSIHYPPYPRFMVDVAVKAIQLFEADLPDEEIELPDQVSFHGRDYVTAREAVNSLHLHGFLYQDHSITLQGQG